MRNPKWQGAVQAWLDAKTREEGPLPAHRTAMLHRIGAPEAASDECVVADVFIHMLISYIFSSSASVQPA